jgi:Fe2+ or Zn2+ uptake regulation protein
MLSRNPPAEVPSLLERLRRRRWRLTAQRRAVAEALEGPHLPLSADELHERARVRLPEISRATVYNVLGELTALGEVGEVASGDRVKRYDPNALERHQHLRCDGCGALRDVHPTGEARLRLPRGERHGFALTGVDVIFHGVCPSCASGRKSKRRARA